MRSTTIPSAVDAEIRAAVATLSARYTERRDLTRQVAGLLFFQFGLNPSIDLVRAYTGRGSKTDLAVDLQDFWRDVRDKGRIKLPGVELPDDLIERQSGVLGDLWRLALERATETLDAERTQAREQVDQARAAALQVEQLLQREQTERERERHEAADATAAAQLRIEELQARLQETDAQRASEVAGRAQALAQVANLQAQLAEGEQQRAAEAERFSRDLAAERQARERSEERLTGETRFAKLQIEEARSTGRALKERLDALRSEKDLIERTMRQQINGQAEALGAARLEVGEARGRISALTDERHRLSNHANDLMRRIAVLEVASAAKEKADGLKA
jgi:chromosome segregation ATPase